MSLDLDRSGWKRVVLRDVVRHVVDRVDPETSGLERFLAGEHVPSRRLEVSDWGVIGQDPIGPMFFKRFRPGHVLYVSRRTYLRKVAVPEFEGITGEKTFVLETVDDGVLLQEFLPFVLSAESFHVHAITNSRGSVNPYLNWGELVAFEFDLPPVDEQKRIAGLLWRVERHRRAASSQRVAGEAAKSEWLARTLQVGSWPSVAVPDLVMSGPTNGKSATANDEGRGVPTLSISAIRGDRVVGGSSVKYIDVRPDDVSRFVIEDDDFLVVRGNGNKQLTGRGGLAVGGLPSGCVFPDLLIRLRFDPQRMLPAFAAAQWNSRRAHAALVRRAKSTNGIWKINGKDVKAHMLVAPPVTAQRHILDGLDRLHESGAATDAELTAVMALQSSLSAEIFGGN